MQFGVHSPFNFVTLRAVDETKRTQLNLRWLAGTTFRRRGYWCAKPASRYSTWRNRKTPLALEKSVHAEPQTWCDFHVTCWPMFFLLFCLPSNVFWQFQNHNFGTEPTYSREVRMLVHLKGSAHSTLPLQLHGQRVFSNSRYKQSPTCIKMARFHCIEWLFQLRHENFCRL